MLNLSDYDYALPEGLIAQAPAEPRDSSRLLVLDRASGRINHGRFREIETFLEPGDLLVLNNTRVFPARLTGVKETLGKVEFLLLAELETNVWDCLVRPGRRIPEGTRVSIGGNGVSAEVVGRGKNGIRRVRFAGVEDIRKALGKLGTIPYPPYVKKPECKPEQYQTVYAREEGSVAAPTAGLHFTDALLDRLKQKGVGIAEITLHVGWGTFRPVRSENITEHKMEKEWYSISERAALAINQAVSSGKKIAAVGTTACRVLESFPEGEIKPGSGWTDLFIYPGFKFTRANALITNFHLPRTTLLMLVSAFAGREKILNAYQEAMNQEYRFFSFGDAMFII